MGVRHHANEQTEAATKRDFHTEGIGQAFELLESNLSCSGRVESLVRVCSLSKNLTHNTSRDLSNSLETESGDDQSNSADPPSLKKIKDNREKESPVYESCKERDVSRDHDMQEIPVGIYTRAERRAKLERYRAKKNRRTFNKKILYACRKSFADSRPRVGGRFVPLKDLQLTTSLAASASNTQRTEQDFSELLASISADLSQKTGIASSRQHSSPIQSHRSLISPGSSAHSQSMSFPSLQNCSSRMSHSFLECSLASVSSRHLRSQQNLHYSQTALQSSYLCSNNPLLYPYSLPLSDYPASVLSALPVNKRMSSHIRSPIDEPSASLLLLSLASSTVTRAEVF